MSTSVRVWNRCLNTAEEISYHGTKGYKSITTYSVHAVSPHNAHSILAFKGNPSGSTLCPKEFDPFWILNEEVMSDVTGL